MTGLLATFRCALAWPALLLACLVLWLSSGAALHHTDDLSGLRVFGTHTVRVHSVSAVPAADPCAACEWAQILPTLPASAAPVFAPAFVRADYAASLADAPRLRVRLWASPRAPPFFS